MTESDGVNEVFEETVRTATAAVIGIQTRRVRQREQRLQEQRLQDAHEARRIDAERATERAQALAQLAVVDQRAWWDTASPADVEQAWQTAVRWRDTEPVANRAAVSLRARCMERTGVDLEHATDGELVTASTADTGDRSGEGADESVGRGPEGTGDGHEGEAQDAADRVEVADLQAAGFPASADQAVGARGAGRRRRPARLHWSRGPERERGR